MLKKSFLAVVLMVAMVGFVTSGCADDDISACKDKGACAKCPDKAKCEKDGKCAGTCKTKGAADHKCCGEHKDGKGCTHGKDHKCTADAKKADAKCASKCPTAEKKPTCASKCPNAAKKQ